MLWMKALNPTNTMNINQLLVHNVIVLENYNNYRESRSVPHNSYLLIEGEVLKVDNTRCADADIVALTNNGLLHLFSSLK